MATSPSDEAKARAEARFNREQQRLRDDEALKAGIAAEAAAVDKKTARPKPDGGHARKDKGKPPPPLVANPDEVKGG